MGSISPDIRNAIIALMQDLYFDGPTARALLIKVGYRPPQIPQFGSAETFWPEVVLRMESGIVVGGLGALLTATVRDHPGNTAAATLLARIGGRQGPVEVLCLFADPIRGSRLRIDRETRLLKEIEDLGGIQFQIRHAVRVTDIIRAILRDRPQILHFGGHGTQDGQLVFEDDKGASADVAAADLAQAIAAAAPHVLDCVFLNSCFTAGNAESFRGSTRTVVGSVTAIRDDCALALARGFYTGLAAGQTVEEAYKTGHAESTLCGCDTSGLHFVSYFAGA
jgi:hypothetical protein